MKRPGDANDLGNYSRLSDEDDGEGAIPRPVALWERLLYFRSLPSAERFIRRERDGEYLAAFDPLTGKLIGAWYVRGRRMVLDRDQQRAVAECIVTHNHPDGWDKVDDQYFHGGESFSDADVSFACRCAVAELRAISREYLYIMRPPPDGWGQAYWEQTMLPLIPQAEAEFLRSDWEQSVTRKAYGYYHALWTKVAERTGVYYERSRIH